MASGAVSAWKRFFLWDYPRAGWQYDVMVTLILAFIFLTPRDMFRDQPRGSSIVRLPPEQGLNVFWVAPELLTGIQEADRNRKAEDLLRSRFGKRENVVRLHAILDHEDSEKEVKGYMAFTQP